MSGLSGRPASAREEGSILLLVLFVCLGVAVLVQVVAAVAVCLDSGNEAEARGRLLMEENDSALAWVRDDLLGSWSTFERRLDARDGWPAGVWASVAAGTGSPDLLLEVTAAHETSVLPVEVSAWIERGSDGFDLPFVGLVADQVTWASGRANAWLQTEEAVGLQPTGLVRMASPSPLLGPGVSLSGLGRSWGLDDGWRRFCMDSAPAVGADGLPARDGLAPGPQVIIFDRRSGTTSIPADWGNEATMPALFVVIGGASVDASERGDVYGVIVADGGAVFLEGTRLHGAVFATRTVDMGVDGGVTFSPAVLRWATDRSLVRTRLVPGTRREAVE